MGGRTVVHLWSLQARLPFSMTSSSFVFLSPFLSITRFSRPHLPVALRRLGGVRAGAWESPGRPLGWQPQPGVVATPSPLGRRLGLPAAPRPGHSRMKYG